MLSEIRVAEAIESNGLQVFGLHRERRRPIDYGTLDEALSDGSMEVVEIGEHGSVPTLEVVNRSGRSVLLMAGEQLDRRQAEPRGQCERHGRRPNRHEDACELR